MRIALAVLTLNAGDSFEKLLKEIEEQTVSFSKKLLVDSGSVDHTVFLAKKYKYEVIETKQKDFNHGQTRGLCVELLKNTADIVIFITQDILLFDKNSVSELIQFFSDGKIGAAYGRQLPHRNASPIAAQARLFNYPEKSCRKTYDDRFRLGIKTPFMSDSFAAYRLSALTLVGGFPRAIVSEDMYVGAKLLMHGFDLAYVGTAKVYHSHDYTLAQEFRRYFDIGVFQTREAWIGKSFGRAEGEGFRLVLNQLRYLWKNKGRALILKAVFANFVRLLGYKIGMYEKYLPKSSKVFFSGQPYFFKQ